LQPLTIIYTTFNEIDIIERSLASVADWTDDLLVVDSFSTDGTAELLREIPGLTLTQRKVPRSRRPEELGHRPGEVRVGAAP
jgi:glycosyltransferase involved in cell wall biosynthesis